MAWIESHDELPTHRKTLKAARKLKVSAPTVVGHLHFLWYWCLTHAPDGRLEEMDADDVAAAAGWDDEGEPFVKALLDCGWLDDDAGTLVVHDWWEGAGKTIKRRKFATERQRRARDTEKGGGDGGGSHAGHDERSRDSHGDVTRDTHAGHGADRDSDRDKNQTPSSTDVDRLKLVDVEEDDGFEAFWDAYPRHHESRLKGGGGTKSIAHKRWKRLSRNQRAEVMQALGPYGRLCAPGGRIPKNAEGFLVNDFWKTYLELPDDSDDEFIGGVRRVR
jgi:hypothetical protein